MDTGEERGVGDRARIAVKLLELRHGGATLTQERLAEWVSAEAGESVGQSVVSRWLDGAWPRTQAQRLAWARVLGVDPGWLYFGDESGAPAPAGMPTQHGSPASTRREPMVAPEDGLVPSPRPAAGRRRANGSP